MGLTHREYLSSDKYVYGCVHCTTHLSIVEAIESKNFNGQHGRAFLFTYVVNVTEGPAEDRAMTTGLHTVRDISCSKCNTVLGWKYVRNVLRLAETQLTDMKAKWDETDKRDHIIDRAYDASQRYKEGKFILEQAMIKQLVE